jgi:hypothetical protein
LKGEKLKVKLDIIEVRKRTLKVKSNSPEEAIMFIEDELKKGNIKLKKKDITAQVVVEHIPTIKE